MNFSKNIFFLLYAFLFLVNGQEQQQQEQPPPEQHCECPITQERYEQCVQDYWLQHDQRQALEQQLHEVKAQAEDRVSLVEGQLREQCQKETQQLQEEKQRELDAAQEVSSSLKIEHQKCKSDLQEYAVSLQEAQTMASSSRRALEDTKRTLEKVQQSKTIITIDYDLLNQRLDEIKSMILKYWNDFVALCKTYLDLAYGKLVEFKVFLETKVLPEIQHFFEKDVLPFCQKTYKTVSITCVKAYKDASAFVEKTYAPYREPVNQKMAQAKTVLTENYQTHLEPKVKEYKLDQYAAQAKEEVTKLQQQAKVQIEHGHQKLVTGIRDSSRDAMKIVQKEGGPDFAVESLQSVNQHADDAALYLEYFVGFWIAFFLFKWMFFGKKKKASKKKRTKAEWEKEQLMKRNGNVNNGKKISNKATKGISVKKNK